jgi:OOP family OmpA-OmpF porin
MTNVFTKRQIGLAVSCAIGLGMTGSVMAAEINPVDTGYLTDQRTTVVRSDFGLCWHTGTGPAVSTVECDGRVVPAPAAKVVEPAPKPMALAAAAPAPKPAIQRVTLDADALFDFDKAVLRPAGRLALDDFVGKIQGINPDMINAIGYTDRFGSEAYNQRLSEKRVESVKTYLVSKGIAADRVHTEGRGESQPITKAGECEGAKSAKVVACLQPDRRVEIEVIGDRVDRISYQQ